MKIFIIFILFYLVGYLSYKISYLVHELGHLISATLVGWNVISMQIGNYGIFKRADGWSFERKYYSLSRTLIISPIEITKNNFFMKFLFVTISGYLMNIIFIIFLAVYCINSSGLIRYIILVGLIVSIITLIQTLKCEYNDKGLSDSLAIKLLVQKKSREDMLKILLFESEIFKDIKYYEDLENEMFFYPEKYKLPEVGDGLSKEIYYLVELMSSRSYNLKSK